MQSRSSRRSSWIPTGPGHPRCHDLRERRPEISGVPNLNYITFPANTDQNVRRLREITPFTRHHVPDESGSRRRGAGAPRQPLPTDSRGWASSPRPSPWARRSTRRSPRFRPDTDAVYVYPLIQLPPGETPRRLVQALIDRRLPSFSYWGRPEVELGLLASLYPGEGFDRLGRRVALNVQRILMGEDPGTLPVGFERRQRSSLNVETARAIGVFPSWERLDRGGAGRRARTRASNARSTSPGPPARPSRPTSTCSP